MVEESKLILTSNFSSPPAHFFLSLQLLSGLLLSSRYYLLSTCTELLCHSPFSLPQILKTSLLWKLQLLNYQNTLCRRVVLKYVTQNSQASLISNPPCCQFNFPWGAAVVEYLSNRGDSQFQSLNEETQACLKVCRATSHNCMYNLLAVKLMLNIRLVV